MLVFKELIDRLFLLMRMVIILLMKMHNITNTRYFLQRLKIENYNIETDGRNFYDQPINDMIKQYEEIRKISTG